jgi:hypothetical protein
MVPPNVIALQSLSCLGFDGATPTSQIKKSFLVLFFKKEPLTICINLLVRPEVS